MVVSMLGAEVADAGGSEPLSRRVTRMPMTIMEATTASRGTSHPRGAAAYRDGEDVGGSSVGMASLMVRAGW